MLTRESVGLAAPSLALVSEYLLEPLNLVVLSPPTSLSILSSALFPLEISEGEGIHRIVINTS